jgi:hypothetical protein
LLEQVQHPGIAIRSTLKADAQLPLRSLKSAERVFGRDGAGWPCRASSSPVSVSLRLTVPGYRACAVARTASMVLAMTATRSDVTAHIILHHFAGRAECPRLPA